MSATPLTNRQRNAIADLVRAGPIEAIGAGGDERRARSFMANAVAAHDDMQRVKTSIVRHDLAYAVMHDVGEAICPFMATEPSLEGKVSMRRWHAFLRRSSTSLRRARRRCEWTT